MYGHHGGQTGILAADLVGKELKKDSELKQQLSMEERSVKEAVAK